MIDIDTRVNRHAQICEDLSKYGFQYTLAMMHVAKRLCGA